MDNGNDTNRFSYTYSAKEQAELKRIREKYEPRVESEDKMEKLRRLDRSVISKARAVALTVGVIGTLIMGMGMSLVMTEFATILGAYEHLAPVIGIGIGVVGGILAGIAYPLYGLVIRTERKRIAPEIIRLTDELMK